MSSSKKAATSSKKKASPKKHKVSKLPAPPIPAKQNNVKPDEMTPELLEFITAIDEYKRQRSRPFPSWGEVLEIVKLLGYEKAA